MTKILIGRSDVDLDYPVCRPSLDLDFTQEELDPRITFTRGSTGTRVNRNRVIETVDANQPRFDYDPVTGECKGLLIEESRQNYELYSGDPTQWASNTNMTLTGNTIVLPTGETSTNVEWRGTDSGANVKLLRPGPSGAGVAAGETWTFSIFLRAGTEQTVHLTFQNQTGGDSVGSTFNLVTGQFPGSITGTNAANGSRYFQYFGNGWYRVWLTNTYQSSSSGQQTFVRLRANTTSMQMTTSFSAWGAQLEKGAFPTSYIPTTASTVTRSADVATMTGTNFSSWYNQNEGTLFANAAPSTNAAYTGWIYLLGTDFNNGISFYRQSDYQPVIRIRSSVRDEYNKILGAIGFNQIWRNAIALKSAFAFKTNDFNSLVSGVSAFGSRATSGTLPSFTGPLYLGGLGDGTQKLNGTISRLTYYPRRLKDNQLQMLTS